MGEYDQIIREEIRKSRASPMGPFPGMLEQPNIDLENRPKVEMPNGSVATVYSRSYEFGGKEVLLPLVSDDGRIMDDKEAKEQFKRTGKHLGVFDSIDAANTYAEELHKSQERYYASPSQRPK